ncbi:ATP-binding protein [Acuticoccus sp. MNP-M23]|uniref:ATP-binding protein n=1 Tax=Acuticoccus sp. MNP-M23 TaxID=3072793 RepID=UPI002815E6C5|nr:ATP-binding protein [Acuticoccus sp. MNP-M23]WMS42979.1 ATP-binding protein [Acuticoccus sp. MNP-M23]
MSQAFTLTLASSDDPGLLAAAVEAFAEDQALPMKSAFTLDLVLEEIVTNIINHGAGPGGATVDITVQRDGDALKGTVRDNAAPFDPLTRPPVDVSASVEEREIGGLGIHLVREMTETLGYTYADGHNVLTFTIGLKELT